MQAMMTPERAKDLGCERSRPMEKKWKRDDSETDIFFDDFLLVVALLVVTILVTVGIVRDGAKWAYRATVRAPMKAFCIIVLALALGALVFAAVTLPAPEWKQLLNEILRNITSP